MGLTKDEKYFMLMVIISCYAENKCLYHNIFNKCGQNLVRKNKESI